LSGLGLDLHNPYVGTVKKGNKTIGMIGISMPTVDKTKEVLKYVGLDSFIDRNLHLTGVANILGKKYKIDSVYKNKVGEKQSSPCGYRVTQNSKTLGLIQVDKNLAGGQILQIWITSGLDPLVEQSVVSTLLVCGYAI